MRAARIEQRGIILQIGYYLIFPAIFLLSQTVREKYFFLSWAYGNNSVIPVRLLISKGARKVEVDPQSHHGHAHRQRGADQKQLPPKPENSSVQYVYCVRVL